jgi:hypothetical protein
VTRMRLRGGGVVVDDGDLYFETSDEEEEETRMNTAQAGSPGWDDPKQAFRTKIDPQVAVRGLTAFKL